MSLIEVILSIIAVLLIPLIRLVYKAGQNQQRIEDKQVNLVESMEKQNAGMQKLIADKDAVHREIMQTIREDRAATDKRLRWLEENVWTSNTQNRK